MNPLFHECWVTSRSQLIIDSISFQSLTLMCFPIWMDKIFAFPILMDKSSISKDRFPMVPRALQVVAQTGDANQLTPKLALLALALASCWWARWIFHALFGFNVVNLFGGLVLIDPPYSLLSWWFQNVSNTYYILLLLTQEGTCDNWERKSPALFWAGWNHDLLVCSLPVVILFRFFGLVSTSKHIIDCSSGTSSTRDLSTYAEIAGLPMAFKILSATPSNQPAD